MTCETDRNLSKISLIKNKFQSTMPKKLIFSLQKILQNLCHKVIKEAITNTEQKIQGKECYKGVPYS